MYYFSLGLDAKLLAKILNMSSGRCWSTELYNPCPGVVEGIPASNNYQGGFGVPLMAKVYIKVHEMLLYCMSVLKLEKLILKRVLHMYKLLRLLYLLKL